MERSAGGVRFAVVVRLYFNAHAEAPLVWSVDEGPGTPERKFAWVAVSHVRGVTKYDPAADNVTAPRAWIEFPRGRLDGNMIF